MSEDGLKIECPQCQAVYRIADEKIPAAGAQARCRRCGGQMAVKRPPTASASPAPPPGFQCPNCGQAQSRGEACVACGVIFDKYRRTMPCPTCGRDLPRDSEGCPVCGHRFGAAPDAREELRDGLRRGVDGLKKGEYTPQIQRGIFSFLRGKTREIAIIGAIVLALTLLVGRVPFFSVLFTAEREILYGGGFGPLKMHYPPGAFKQRPVVFHLKVGSTGEEEARGIRIAIDHIPHPVDQLFFTVQNLEAGRSRPYDPEVRVQCSGEQSEACMRMPLERSITSTFQQMAMIYRQEVLSDPMGREEARYTGAPPCAAAGHPESPEAQTFTVEKIPAGAMINLGFICYGSEAPMRWEDFKQVAVTVTGECTVEKGDPQLTALARILSAMGDLF